MTDIKTNGAINSVIELLKILKKEKEVIVQFEKKDKTTRLMKCTLDFNSIPIKKRPRGVDLPKILSKIQSNKILSVFDTEKQDWRSIPFNKLEYLKTTSDDKVYSLNL